MRSANPHGPEGFSCVAGGRRRCIPTLNYSVILRRLLVPPPRPPPSQSHLELKRSRQLRWLPATMIKRRFYKLEHHGGDSASSSSSSSSSESEDFDHEDEGNQVSEEEEKEQEEPPLLSAGSSGSGYESEDSSVNEVNCDSTGLLVNDYEDSGGERQNLKHSQIHEGHPEGTKRLASKNVFKTIDANDPIQAEIVDFVVKCKSVFKCKICPRIVCLSEDTLLQHLRSKRHGRSKKLLREGRLKLMLNSDGEVEEEQETHAERHARTVVLGQVVNKEQETHTEGHASADPLVQKAPKRKNNGQQRQRQRRKMKLCRSGDGDKRNPPQKKQTAKRCKIED